MTRLRRFDELKNDLVATVAHEFRTPLTSLRMAIHLCAEEAVGPLTEKQADLLHAAREDCERLQGIVDDLLDLSRIQVGPAGAAACERVPAAVLVEQALEAHRATAAERGVRAALGGRARARRRWMADPDRLQLVLSQPVANAHPPQPAGGEVRVRARARTGAVRFEVKDTGAGIAPEHQRAHLREVLPRAGRAAGGAGLGLSIAREIVQAHGGRDRRGERARAGQHLLVQLPAAAWVGPARPA